MTSAAVMNGAHRVPRASVPPSRRDLASSFMRARPVTTSMRRIAGQGQEKTWVRWALAGGSDPGSPEWCPCRRCWRWTPPMLTPLVVTRMPTGRLMTGR